MSTNKLYPSNPLGVIALFVFFIEAISTVSLKILVDGKSEHTEILLYFIIFYPSIIAAFFFIFLWFKREALFGPSDFQNEGNFIQLMQKNLPIMIKKVKQEKLNVSPGSKEDDNYGKLERLLILSEAHALLDNYKSPSDLFPIVKHLEALFSNDHTDSQVALILAYSYKRLDKIVKAIETLTILLDNSVESGKISKKEHSIAIYNRACYRVLLYSNTLKESDKIAAIKDLQYAIDLDAYNKNHALHDGDFDLIRDEKEFKQLVTSTSNSM